MARKKGSKDLKPRKHTRHKPTTRPAGNASADQSQHETQTAGQTTTATAAETVSEFDSAVASVLGDESLSRGGPSPSQGTLPPASESGSPAAFEEDDSFCGRDAWEAIIEAPFRSAAIWLNVPAFEQLGKMRAKMLATPSYPLYRHYVKQWLTDNPDDEMFICKTMTLAVLATVLQEAYAIFRLEMARRKLAANGLQTGKVVLDESQLKQGGSVN